MMHPLSEAMADTECDKQSILPKVSLLSLLPSQEMLYVLDRLTLHDHGRSVSPHRARMMEKENYVWPRSKTGR
jgi:hypothetical protein